MTAELSSLCLAGKVFPSGATWCCNLPKGHVGDHDDGLGEQWSSAEPEQEPPTPVGLLPALYSAMDSAATRIALDGRDWSRNGTDAWLYGIFVGWSDDPTGGDVDQDGGALQEVAARHLWDDATVDRLRTLRAAVAGFDIKAVAELSGGATT